MIDHITIYVSDLIKSKVFYQQAFKPFSYSVTFGQEHKFWTFAIGNGALFEIAQYQGKNKLTPCHIAFRANSHKQVQQFYAAALAAGGRFNGKPGLRPDYTEQYYAAFILDLDGYNIEAVYDSDN